MKFLLVSISMLFSSLILVNIQDDHSSEYFSKSTNSVSNLTAIVDIKQLPSCQSCHGDEGEPAYSPALNNYLNENFNPNLVIHQVTNPLFVEGLETFVVTHDDDEAWAKYVDRQKIIEQITEY